MVTMNTTTHRKNPDWGRPRPDITPGMADLWRIARLLNEQKPGPWEWIPWAAIEIRYDLLPRSDTDTETVEKYIEIIDLTPPITVEKDSLRLIGGLHRIAASHKASRDHVRVIELDTGGSDDMLADFALRDNVTHGKPLSAKDRMDAAKKLFARHHPVTGGTTGKAWTAGQLQAFSGVSDRTFVNWQRDYEERRARHEASIAKEGEPTTREIFAGSPPVLDSSHDFSDASLEAPRVTHRIGADGVSRPVEPMRQAAAQTNVGRAYHQADTPYHPKTATNSAWGQTWQYALADALRQHPVEAANSVPATDLEKQHAMAVESWEWFESYADRLGMRLDDLKEQAGGDAYEDDPVDDPFDC